MMQRAKEPSGSKMVSLAMTEESLETELVYWIRDLVRSDSKADTRLGSSSTFIQRASRR